MEAEQRIRKRESEKSLSASTTVKKVKENVEDSTLDKFQSETPRDSCIENSNRSVQAISPWEQHSSVINLARFDYQLVDSIHEGKQGFLITCGFRREKSATKEAWNAICQLCGLKEMAPNSEKTPSENVTSDFQLEELRGLSLVKLGCNGLVFIVSSGKNVIDVINIAQSILQNENNKDNFRFCERIIPIQATCQYCPDALRLACENLAKICKLLKNSENKLKLAVSFRQRVTPNEEKNVLSEKKGKGSENFQQLNRNVCIESVMSGIQMGLNTEEGPRVEITVDLSNPHTIIFVETLPLARSKPVLGISIVPSELCEKKPRFALKRLTVLQKGKMNVHHKRTSTELLKWK